MLQRKGYTVHEMRHAVKGANARVEGEKGGGWMDGCACNATAAAC